LCIFSGKYNPRGPDIRKILKKYHREVICGDEKAIEVLPEGAICVAYKRNARQHPKLKCGWGIFVFLY
jgi:hypothetical protein